MTELNRESLVSEDRLLPVLSHQVTIQTCPTQTGPSGPGFESQLRSFFREKISDEAVFNDSTRIVLKKLNSGSNPAGESSTAKK